MLPTLLWELGKKIGIKEWLALSDRPPEDSCARPHSPLAERLFGTTYLAKTGQTALRVWPGANSGTFNLKKKRFYFGFGGVGVDLHAHDISRTPRRVRWYIPIDRVLILVDIVVNYGNDALEARRIAENLLLLKRDKMVA
eukprot:scaffold16227_cov90-Skeletonema_dohrnii-CCMP3373.AAC.1